MEVQKSSREVLAHSWSKSINKYILWKKFKSKIGHIEGDKRNNFTLPCITPPPRQHSTVKRDVLGHNLSQGGKWEYVIEKPASPVVHDTAQRGPLFSCSIWNWDVLHKLGREGLGDLQPGLSVSIKGTWILLIRKSTHEPLGMHHLQIPLTVSKEWRWQRFL